jgi:hypothetical protein
MRDRYTKYLDFLAPLTLLENFHFDTTVFSPLIPVVIDDFWADLRMWEIDGIYAGAGLDRWLRNI